MRHFTLIRSVERLKKELVSWQFAAIGLLAMSVILHTASIIGFRAECIQMKEKIVLLERELNQAEHARDIAVEQLGSIVLQVEADKQEREEQSAAFESVGIYKYVGECTITAYCPCEECCGKWSDGMTATGIPAGPGVVAVDDSIVPIGSTVIIDGQRYLAADTGVSGFCVDIAMSDHTSALEYGVNRADVWIIPPESRLE